MVPEKPSCNGQIEALVAYSRQQAEGSSLVDGSSDWGLRVELPGYAIVEQIRGGGQGTVFRAVQRTTNREVAIKILHNGSLARRSDQVRFEREIKALALLQHPGIVRLVDGGAVEGRRFLVMDFIEGESLDEYLREEAPPIREWVALLAKVCDAVAAAHVRGVVHRDLKPSNIRVDHSGDPHVLDFGLARLLDTDGNAGTGRDGTLTGQFLGSPSWASPEQAEGAVGRIDTRTDVYALGLLLYHSITGGLPYPIAGSLNDTLNHIRLTAPARPRAKERSIDTDLETIVLKCLSKEQDRRYQSAGELAAELRRYLCGEPIEARRDSSLYVLSRTLKRHRVTTAAVLAFLLLLLAYALTTTILYQRAVTATAEAVTSRRELQETASLVVGQLAEGMSRVPRGSALQKTMYETAHAQLVKLLGHAADDPSLLADRAVALIGLGDIALAVGDPEGALRHREEALSIRRRLLELTPDEPQRMRDLAVSFVLVGDVAKHRSDYQAALNWYQEALAIHESLVAAEPDHVGYLDDLTWSYERIGGMLLQQGNLIAAGAQFDKRHEIAERLVLWEPTNPARLRGLVASLGWLARMSNERGDAEGVKRIRLESLDTARRLHELDPSNRHDTFVLANSLAGEGHQLLAEDRLAEAESYFVQSRNLVQALTEAEPTSAYFQSGLGHSHFGFGQLFEKLDQLDVAERHYDSALGVFEALAANDPSNLSYAEITIDCLARKSEVARRLGRIDDANVAAKAGTELALCLLEASASDPHRLAMATDWIAQCGKNPFCEPSLAVTAAEQAVTQAPGMYEPWRVLALSLAASKRCSEAIVAAEHGISLLVGDDVIHRARFEEIIETCSEAD